MRSSENTLAGIAESLVPYYNDELIYDTNAIDKFLSDNTIILDDIKDILINIEDWTEDNLENALKAYQTDKNLPIPKVNQPIRIALTGSTKSPSLGLTLSIFGKDTAIKRIEALIDFLH
jgi:glutamyl-tRNA synthetase